MQVSSTNSSGIAGLPLALQSARSRNNAGAPAVSAVGRQVESHENLSQSSNEIEPKISLDSGTEKKLGRIKEIQIAFKAALSAADSIQSQYLLDPII